MARRRKAVAAPAQPPRTRRATRASEASPVVNKQVSDDAPTNQDCENENSQDSNQPSFPMILMNHKNFGKYRCLSSKSGGPSDEIINNVEVKIVDPCASSESDSNSVETRLTDSPTVKCFFKYNRGTRGSNSSSPISIKSKTEYSESAELQSDNSNHQITLSSILYDTQLPDPTLGIISSTDPRRSGSSMDSFNNILGRISPYLKSDKNSNDEFDFLSDNFASEVTIEEEQEKVKKINREEDEMYTIYEIISDDQNNDTETPCLFSNTELDVFNESVKAEEKDQLDNLTIEDTETKKIKRSTKTIKKVIKKKQVETNKESNSTPSMSEEETKMDVETVGQNTEKIDNNYSTDSSSSSSTGVRRSSRIKTISIQKQRSKGHGLVKGSQKNFPNALCKDIKTPEGEFANQDASQTVSNSQNSPVFPVPISDSEIRPVKVKSRWRRSSEMEMGSRSPTTPPLSSPNASNKSFDAPGMDQKTSVDEAIQERLNQFQIILENEYHCDRAVSKEAKKMICDCFLTKEEMERGELGCGEDCLNRLLMIECNSRCPVKERCTNRRFQSKDYSLLRVIKTDKKGLGIEAVSDISSGEFLMEYVGEVLNWEQFNQRAQEYSSDKNMHHYFMSLKGDAVIDATLKGNISRFINHSCDPNAETQKWTVNGDLRIGFFSKRDIKAGDEITFDYQFQRYGKEGLRCFCEASNCRGWIGEEPESSDEEEEEEEEEEDEEEEAKNVPEEPKVETPDATENVAETPAETLVEVKLETETMEVSNEADPVKSEETPAEEPVQVPAEETVKVKKVLKRTKLKQSNIRCFNDLLQDMDLKQEMNNLTRTGVRNQSHTLSLCRAMVRAKHMTERIALLKLLASADLPCRRLFLDYRGLRLLNPWCENSDACTRLEILTALEKLPVLNKTILKESKIIYNVESWLADIESNPTNKDDSSDESNQSTPVLIDESTGLPVENPNAKVEEASLDNISENIENKKPSIVYSSPLQKTKIQKLAKKLIDRWSILQEIFKIPKKERIQLMKEHERQANEPQSKSDKDCENNSESERWEERYNRHDRDKKRVVLPSPEAPRRGTRFDDRILTPVPALSKEERRRVFAARAAHQEQIRRAQTLSQQPSHFPPVSRIFPPLPKNSAWIQPTDKAAYSGIINGTPTSEYPTPEYVQPQTEYMQVDYQQSDYSAAYQMSYSQQIYPIPAINTSVPPPGFSYGSYASAGYQTHNYTPTQTLPPSSPYSTLPLTPGAVLQTPSPHYNQLPTQPISSITTQTNNIPIPTVAAPSPSTPIDQSVYNPQPIQSLASLSTIPYQYPKSETKNTTDYYHKPAIETVENKVESIITTPNSISSTSDKNQDADVVRWTPVRLPSRWRSMKDARGRTYYYHVKFRTSQWIPPLYSPTLNSRDEDSSDDEQESETEAQNEESESLSIVKDYPIVTEKVVEGLNGICQVMKEEKSPKKNGTVKGIHLHSITIKKKRPGLVTERIISPRQEEDIVASKIDLKRYRENKEKLRRRKEQALMAAGIPDALNKYKKRHKSMKHKKEIAVEKKHMVNEKAAKKIKEIFTAHMARVMVHNLDPYRREDCPVGRITNTSDFKHLAKKLTHFVMLKELKHCQTVNELECNDSVKQKAKEFVKKYMAKYGPVYQRPADDIDF